jgi:hypothetical protein
MAGNDRVVALAEAVFGPANPRHRELVTYGYHLAPEIPTKKLTGACQGYARFDFARETPVWLLDDTVFGTGKRGLLVTTEALHFAVTNPLDGFSEDRGRIPLAAIQALRIVGDALYVNDAKLGSLTQPAEAAVLAVEAFFRELIGGPAPVPPPPADREAIFETLRGLKALHDDGVLTAAEFQAKKQDLLGRL